MAPQIDAHALLSKGLLPLPEIDMTERDEKPLLHEEWIGVITQLWTSIGKPLDPERLRIYCSQLQQVPIGLLERSITRLMKENTWLSVPPIGAIWQAVRHELGDPYDLNIALANQ